MFDHIETWIFDLDNTLYHPRARLFDQINTRMTRFIMDELGVGRAEADRLRGDYWHHHGTTLGGLIANHGTDPGKFLADVHEIDLSALKPDLTLAEAIRALPGRRIVHTNGARTHAERVLAVRGLTGAFDAVYAIEDKDLVPKPRAEAYARVTEMAGIDAARAAMIEDDMRNLEVPKALGMTTIWLCHQPGRRAEAFVDHRITGLTRFLRGLPRAGEDI
ncbi:MAG: pyrimidine 5'-nucleotidase [Paracoccaceae bacterium]|nr:pyrimidine 5'-nucleotidase [Paracoccaceae bacterium]